MEKDFLSISDNEGLREFLKIYYNDILSYNWYFDRTKSICLIKFKDGSKGNISI